MGPRKRENVIKPPPILLYSPHTHPTDISDQIRSYFTVLITVRWYHKLAFEAIFGTASINAENLYVEYTGEKIQIHQFQGKLL